MNRGSETDSIRARYARRHDLGLQSIYDPLRPSVYMAQQERERVLMRRILTPHLKPVASRRLIEIGCGSGANLMQLLQMGFRPENLVANELLPDRVEVARALLPSSVEVICGDATLIDRPEQFDAVLISTVFTSILDNEFQQRLADSAWKLLKPGGGIIWYDFVYDNPRNLDVRGVRLERIKELFPTGDIEAHRTTLAPPISRRVTIVHPWLYSLFNTIPFLRTHLLCWIGKQ